MGLQAVRLLQELGYTSVRYYRGGLDDWEKHGGHLASLGEVDASPAEQVSTTSGSKKAQATTPLSRAVSLLDRLSARALAYAWVTLALTSALAYWLCGAWLEHGLITSEGPLGMRLDTLPTALYFSLVTITSLGYGDVGPVGLSRAFSAFEAIMGLLIFSLVVSRFVSRRQEQLLEEVHRISFEDRLSRIQTHLHQVLIELQNIEAHAVSNPRRVEARLDSIALIFVGELRTVHELLYSPVQNPDESAMLRILSTLSSALHELCEILESSTPTDASSLQNTIATIGQLAGEICSNCIPDRHAQALQTWTRDIERVAARLRNVNAG